MPRTNDSNATFASWWDRCFTPVDSIFLPLLRVIVGVSLLWVLWEYSRGGFISSLAQRPFRFTYHGFSWLPIAPPWALQTLFALLAILGILLIVGFLTRISAVVAFFGFFYVFLLEKAGYFNHYYLIGLLLFLLIILPVNCQYSIDGILWPQTKNRLVSIWMLWLVRFQLAIPYLFGGIAKLNLDWLRGQPMQLWMSQGPLPHLLGPAFGQRWMAVFFSWGGLLFDLGIVPLLLYRPTRRPAFAAAVLFHVLNSIMFRIDVFPWMMIAATLVFFPPDSLRRWLGRYRAPKLSDYSPPQQSRQRWIVALLMVYAAVHCIVPLRLWAYSGQTHWTEQGHRFAWRMMLRTKVTAVQYVVIDTATGRSEICEFWQWLTPRQLNKMGRDPEMLREFAHFIKQKYEQENQQDVKVHAVVLCSLNGRKPQQLVDPNVDLASQPRQWGAFSWILPLKEPFRNEPWDIPVPEWTRHVTVEQPAELKR